MAKKIVRDITEHKHVEEALIRLAAIIESSPDAIIGKTLEGIITSWNPAAEEYYGYSAEEAINQHISIIVPPDRQTEIGNILQKIKNGKKIDDLETVWKHKNGHLIPVLITVYPIKDHTGKVIGVSTFARDITKQKRAEERFRKILEATPDAILMANPEGKIIFINAQTEKLFGYQKEELLGQAVEVLIPESYRSRHPEHRKRYFESPHTRPMGIGMELYGLRKNGDQFPIEISLSPFETDEGQTALATVRDITEKKQAEERFQRILEATPDAILMVNSKGEIIFINSQTEKLFGYQKEELLGQVIEVLIPEPYRSRHPEHRKRYFESPHTRPMGIGMELYGLRKNGEQFPVEISLSPLETKEGIVALGAIRDITERKKVEVMKNEFVSVVSHELRTPLTSIQGSLELLIGGATGDLPEKAMKFLFIAKQNSGRLIRLINDILDIEKIEAGKMEFRLQPLNISELTKEAILANQSYSAQFSVTIKNPSSYPNVKVYADPDRLLQVLTNLISNAIKFTPQGSEVTLKIQEQKNTVKVSVQDQGKGIPEEFQSRIFQRFAQADASVTRELGGTGLGLSISKSIIEKLNGKIGFTTQKNKGSIFYFELPIYKNPCRGLKKL